MKDIILARYNEDISWIKGHRESFENVYVFNKGDNLEFDNCIIENITNEGREAHTYLYFIVKYYDQLDPNKIYIFSQAQPNNDVQPFMSIVNSLNENSHYPVPLTNFFGNEDTQPHLGKKSYDPTHPYGIPIKQYFMHLFYIDKMFDVHTCNYTGLWGVIGKNILYRSKEFYQHCLKMLSGRKNPYEAYTFERLWKYIFNPKYPDWITHYETIRTKYAKGDYHGLVVE